MGERVPWEEGIPWEESILRKESIPWKEGIPWKESIPRKKSIPKKDGMFTCPACGESLEEKTNTARNVLKRGLEGKIVR